MDLRRSCLARQNKLKHDIHFDWLSRTHSTLLFSEVVFRTKVWKKSFHHLKESPKSYLHVVSGNSEIRIRQHHPRLAGLLSGRRERCEGISEIATVPLSSSPPRTRRDKMADRLTRERHPEEFPTPSPDPTPPLHHRRARRSFWLSCTSIKSFAAVLRKNPVRTFQMLSRALWHIANY